MIFLFWFSLTLVAFIYAGYPLCIYFIGVFRPKAWKRLDNYPTVSIILAVHNAKSIVERQVMQLLALDYPTNLFELIVVSDGSDDGTNEVLSQLRDKRLRVFGYPERRGKAFAINLALSHAKNDVLMFVDIRPTLDRSSLRRLVSNLADPTVGCAGGEVVMRDDGRAAVQHGGSMYWRYETWIRELEATVDSVVGLSGSFYVMHRSLATELPEGIILDDMYQPLNVIRKGYRVVFDRGAHCWDIWPRRAHREFLRKVRTLTGNLQLVQMAPWLLTPRNRVWLQFIGHKILRLTTPILLVNLLISSLLLWDRPLYATLLGLQVVAYSLGLLGLVSQNRYIKRVAAPATSFIVLNGAAACSIYKFFRHRRELWKIWVPDNSALLSELREAIEQKR